jgi:hypothetical protein
LLGFGYENRKGFALFLRLVGFPDERAYPTMPS